MESQLDADLKRLDSSKASEALKAEVLQMKTQVAATQLVKNCVACFPTAVVRVNARIVNRFHLATSCKLRARHAEHSRRRP